LWLQKALIAGRFRPPPVGLLAYRDLDAKAFIVLRPLALPEAVKHWPLTTLQNKLIKIGAKVVRHKNHSVIGGFGVLIWLTRWVNRKMEF
jgi:hypothetical protein